VSRDDLRLMLRSGGGGWGERVTERRIDIVRDAVILSLLRAGTDCVADSTNLNPVTVGDLARIAHRAGAAYQVIDFTGVPLETCLARNAERESGQRVPEQWIRTMHARFVKGADTAR
jgi:predicted kinase